MSKKVLLVAGARPNFMKVAPVWSRMRKERCLNPVLLHTGQHYDYEMSKVFFEDLDMPEPNYFLGAGSGSHAEQTAKVMVKFEKVLQKERPDLTVVFGDVNSTMACSVTANKLLIPVAHVEAGLRSFDMTMPEEINRKVTDAISDLLFTPSEDGDENLIREGVKRARIHFVGNIMIDSLISLLKKIRPHDEEEILTKFGVKKNHFVLVTLHRPSNVDDRKKLSRILTLFRGLSKKIPLIFPVHPRTRRNLEAHGMQSTSISPLNLVDPLRYRDFIILEKCARFVITDSGGIQEETTFLHIPCLTLRPNTERPITISQGTNELVAIEQIREKADSILAGKWKTGVIPRRWDGKTADRIVKVLTRWEPMV